MINLLQKGHNYFAMSYFTHKENIYKFYTFYTGFRIKKFQIIHFKTLQYSTENKKCSLLFQIEFGL